MPAGPAAPEAALPGMVRPSRPSSPEAGLAVPAQTSAPAAVEDGRYAGLSILTSFHGDCNAGGTGEIVVRGRALTYRDALNPALSGLLDPTDGVDLVSGGVHLTGRFAAMVFTGHVSGGPCEYQMRFEHVAG